MKDIRRLSDESSQRLRESAVQEKLKARKITMEEIINPAVSSAQSGAGVVAVSAGPGNLDGKASVFSPAGPGSASDGWGRPVTSPIGLFGYRENRASLPDTSELRKAISTVVTSYQSDFQKRTGRALAPADSARYRQVSALTTLAADQHAALSTFEVALKSIVADARSASYFGRSRLADLIEANVLRHVELFSSKTTRTNRF